jgi:hypothetical protein
MARGGRSLPACLRVVRRPLRCADATANSRLADHSRWPRCVDLGTDRLRQNLGRVHDRARWPGPARRRRSAARADSCGLRVPAQSPDQRHSKESRNAAGRAARARERTRHRTCADSHGGAFGRHAGGRPCADAAPAAARARHDARVALHHADRAEVARALHACPDDHRR